MRRDPAPRISDDRLRELFAEGLDDVAIAEQACNGDVHYVFRRRMRLGLKRKPGARKSTRKIAQKAMRHGKHTMHAPATMPAVNNPAFSEMRTIFPSTVHAWRDVPRLFIDGRNSRKIGGQITKGWHAGYAIYTLTLQERATCPTSCDHWRSCFGNQMHLARRIDHRDNDLAAGLEAELDELAKRHPSGFALRLHVLGDFFSEDYVDFWRRMIGRHSNMFVFGFTARWNPVGDPIARKLLFLVYEKWHRFAVRFSNAPVDECSTVSIEHPLQKPADAIICPMQMGKADSCGSCGLCWHTRRRIAFLQH